MSSLVSYWANVESWVARNQRTIWTALRVPQHAHQVGLFSGGVPSPCHSSVMGAWGFFTAADGK